MDDLREDSIPTPVKTPTLEYLILFINKIPATNILEGYDRCKLVPN